MEDEINSVQFKNEKLTHILAVAIYEEFVKKFKDDEQHLARALKKEKDKNTNGYYIRKGKLEAMGDIIKTIEHFIALTRMTLVEIDKKEREYNGE